MSLYFEKLENKIVLSSFGHYKSKSHKVEQNYYDAAAVIAHVKNNNDAALVFNNKTSPVFVCSITPEGIIVCGGVKSTEIHVINPPS